MSCRMRMGPLRVFILILCASAATAARGEERFTTIERPDFTIDVPHYFIVEPEAGASAALEVWAPPGEDHRGLAYAMSIRVEVVKGVNARRLPIEAAVEHVVDTIRKRYGRDLLGGPAAVGVNVPGADGAAMVIYRKREQGLVWWRFDLHLHAGTDLHIVSAFLNARAGSEVLNKDHPMSELLQKSLLSYKVIRAAATTQAATQPATAPASPPAPPAPPVAPSP